MREEVRYAVYLFIIFAAFRSVLEYFAGSFPIGYDSVNANEMWIRTHAGLLPLDALFKSILYSLNYVVRNPSLTVKIVNIFLEGALASSLYLWIFSITKNNKVAFFAALATCFYFPILRIAWDLSLNMLALIFGLLCLTLLESTGRTKFLLANVLLILSIFSDVITLPIILFVVILRKDRLVRKVVPVAISGVLFLAALFYSTGSHGFLPFVSYELQQGGYLYLGWSAPLFVLYLAAPILPFVAAMLIVKRPWKVDRQLALWIVGSLALLPVYLGYRFAFMAFIGIVPMIVVRIFSVDPNRLLKVFLVVVLFLGFSYAVFSAQSPFPYYTIDARYTTLMPPAFMYNTLPTYENSQVMGLLYNNIGLFNCSSTLATITGFYDFTLAAHVPSCSIYVIGDTGNVSADFEQFVYYGQSHGSAPLYVLWFVPPKSSEPSFWNTYSLVESIGSIGLFVYSPS